MEIGILGPLTVHSGDREAAPSAPKPRQLLAMLAVRAGQAIAMDLLVDELWESSPPRSAVTAVQTYIVTLRRSIAESLRITTDEAADKVLQYTGWGYRLQPGQGAHDALVFTRYAAQGQQALVEGDYGRASLLLRRGLSMWRGPALADVPVGTQLLAHRTSLDERRMSAVEQRIEADLQMGLHQELVGELSGLCIQHPLHENMHSLLMVSLYRAGRPRKSLETFQKLRQNLRAELGMDPSGRTKAIHHAILSGDADGDSNLFRRGAAPLKLAAD
ncbi:hypothetical protein C4J65_11145 [Streptomyces sp. CB09001]|uniref:AfsR/SARP family transcriptional regulator n=1 Tax=Streptomyces sp. CB09001 TaxID=2083284 RepID=UPI000E211627|nr:AfsR/SARP family transcriptional regulator [Streptomyces sp. CB09001]AXL88821.1 hypothetical protein C4J65_11145 [Streptomyces sp. CB09001]